MNNFSNHPKKLLLQDYKNSRNEIINFFKNDDKLISIYEYGSVSAPGISDLDIILVYSKKSKLKIKKKKINITSNFLLQNGTIIKTTQQIFKRFNYIDEFKLKKIYGENIYLDKISKKNKNYLQLISILDWLPERALRLIKVNQNKIIKINELLCLLFSITYSFKKLEIITKKRNQETKKLIQQIYFIRKNWFQMKDKEIFLKKLTKNIFIQVIKELCNYQIFLEDKSIFNFKENKNNKNDVIFKRFKHFKINFLKDKNHKELINLNIKSYTIKNNNIYLPLLLFSSFISP